MCSYNTVGSVSVDKREDTMASRVVQINDKAEHDQIVTQSKDIPTVIYVSNSSLPACKTFTPQYEDLAQRWHETNIKFCQLEFTSETR